MSYRIAGIDVHKNMLAVVVSDVEVDSEYQFERRKFSGNPEQLRLLAAWLLEQEAEEVVMESTAQYWRPVWEALERYWKPICEKRAGARRKSGTLHLAQALSNRGRRGRKRDFPDAERLVKRLVAQELTLSFVPDAEQRLWRTVTRKKYQLRCDRIRLQNQLESLLEEAHIKVSSLVSDLLGLSAQRMLKAIADGETSPATLAALADKRLRATPEQLCDALGACTQLNPVYRRLVKMALEELRLIDEQIGRLDQEMAGLLLQHQGAVQRLAEIPGLGVDSAPQIIAEVGPTAATFPSEKCLSSWVGACPGDDESAGVNHSHRSPKGNRHMRRLLNQAANAAMAVVLADFVNSADVGMIQGGSGTSFAPETLEGLTVIGNVVGQEFQRNVTPKVLVLGLVDYTHPAATEFFKNAVVRNFPPGERGRFGHWREYYVAPSH